MPGVETCEALVGLRRLAFGGWEVTEREGRFLGFGRLADDGYWGDVAGDLYDEEAMVKCDQS